MLKKITIIFALIFIIPGILGFTHAAKIGPDGMPELLHLFMVGAVHNWLHIITGAIGLGAAFSNRYARLYLQAAGMAYGAIAVIGLVQGTTVLGVLPVNTADNVLHVFLAAALLVAGFGIKDKSYVSA